MNKKEVKNVLKEIFFKNKEGITSSIIAKESTVKTLFKGNFLAYVHYSLESEEVELVKVIKCTPALGDVHYQEIHKEVAVREHKMTVKKGITALGKYKAKRQKI